MANGSAARALDLIVSSASAVTKLDDYFKLLATDGTMAMTGLRDADFAINAFSLTMQQRRLTGTNNGGITRTQKMLDFYIQRCAPSLRRKHLDTYAIGPLGPTSAR